MGNKYVLAMYDIRGKQEFIFKTNKLQEIVGASWIIRDLFYDFLYSSALKVGGKIFNYRDPEVSDSEKSFSTEHFEKRMDTDEHGGYIGEVIYEGGGNCLLLLRDEETFQRLTYEFTKVINEKIGTLRVLGTCLEIDDFCDYQGDRQKLQEKHRKNEAQESNICPWSCLPIVQVDRKTSQPLVDFSDLISGDKKSEIIGKIRNKGVKGKVSKESAVKLFKYYSEFLRINGSNKENLLPLERDYYGKNEDFLDNMVTDKGVDSQLAIVYIDGNNMGAKFQDVIGKNRNYDDSIKSLRDLSESTQQKYIEDGIKAAFKDLDFEKERKAFRIVVSAGDETNFIVNAHDAFQCAVNYLEYLKGLDDASACAGIAVFHSHAPYADVYRIAEEACESGKQKMKEEKIQNASFVDFHMCQGAIGTSLEEIREEENGAVISRPWMMWSKDDRDKDKSGVVDYMSEVKPVLRLLQKKGFARTNIKGLAVSSKEGKLSLQMELKRIYAHASDNDKKSMKDGFDELMEKLKKDGNSNIRGIIYDLALSYDTWFTNTEEK